MFELAYSILFQPLSQLRLDRIHSLQEFLKLCLSLRFLVFGLIQLLLQRFHFFFVFVLNLFQRFAEFGHFGAERVSVSYQVVEFTVVFRVCRFGTCLRFRFGVVIVIVIFLVGFLLFRRRVCGGLAFTVDILGFVL